MERFLHRNIIFCSDHGALMIFAPWQAFFFHIYDQVMDGDDTFLDLLLLSMGSLIGFAVLILGVWCSRVESFRYTHYPIRLNRKNRKVYVFRLDGSVLETPWDDLFITIEPAAPGRTFVDGWDLRAHVMSGDRKTVLETFAFGYISDPDNLRHYFEYLRLYMDEGPQAIVEHTPYCLNTVDKKETPVFGFKRLLVDFSYTFFMILMFVPVIFIAIGRAFAMATCKIPRWPIEVEAACPIEKRDPWVRDASTHPAK